ncbi:MAG: hypothetical protein JW954_07260 [Dehalococcoidaceae bacterium]|nr:hypothetical protein [Dehalococcoidaceae bacterium]
MKIRKFITRLAREQSGQLFIMVLIFLVFGSLVLGPLLSYIGSGVLVGQTFETKTEELYAADAGIEDAMWMIYNQDSDEVINRAFTVMVGAISFPVLGLPPYAIDHDDDPGTEAVYIDILEYTLLDTINARTVDITLQFITNSLYYIVSTATGSEGSTTVEVFTKDVTGDYSGITDQIITTPGEFDDSPNLTLNYEEEIPPRDPVEGWGGYWPDTPEKIAQFCEFFFWDVRNEEPYPGSSINLNGVDRTEGPLYREGDMNIYNSSNTDAVLTLDGTLYITGQTMIGKSPKDIIVDLNGNTIFVESNLTGGGNSGTALWVGGNCTLRGPGAIVAIGDIYFEPNIEAGMEEPIFIMSASGTTTLQPGGNFFGALAGEISVETQPGTTITYPEGGFAEGSINFPGIISGRFWGMETWNIN